MTRRMQGNSHPNNTDPQRSPESVVRMEMPGEDLYVLEKTGNVAVHDLEMLQREYKEQMQRNSDV